MGPEYLAHYAQQLAAGDIIQARPEDGMWIGEFLVLYTDTALVRLALLWSCPLEEVEPIENAMFETAYVSYATKWVVRRKGTGELVKGNFPTRGAAENFFQKHLSTAGA